jgi:shikimate dehydrogenase
MEQTQTTNDQYAVIGYPVEHSYSPEIHRIFAQQTGENLSYELLPVEPENFEAAVRKFAATGGKGLNVTVPHKEAAFKLSSELGPEAQRAHAANTLSLLSTNEVRGDNTDGIGLLRDLTQNNHLNLNGKRILILGAGGAARGILPPLLDSDFAELVLANRTVEKANELVELFNAAENLFVCPFNQLGEMGSFDLIVNATSAGLKGESFSFPHSCLGSWSFCYDLAYSAKQTPFVQWARDHGAGNAVQGWGMLIEQAAESFAIWRDVRPDTAPLLQKYANH